MKIYAIKDRLINYFMQPFVGPDDKTVLASVARLVNQGEVTSDIAQAPHQFEIWTLGIVQEDGTLTPEREYLGDCSSLIRGGIRRGRADQQGTKATDDAGNSRIDAPDSFGGENGPLPGSPVPGGTPSSHKQAEEAYTAASRGN